MPCAWIVGEVHDIKACPDVGIEHPLIGSRVMVVVMGSKKLRISHHGFQVAEGDVRVFEEMPGSGEGGIGIRAAHEGIAHQHYIDVIHNEARCVEQVLLWAKEYAVTGCDVNLTKIPQAP